MGGTSVREDARILGAGVHVVVGTPGRVYDMLRRRCLRADNIKVGLAHAPGLTLPLFTLHAHGVVAQLRVKSLADLLR